MVASIAALKSEHTPVPVFKPSEAKAHVELGFVDLDIQGAKRRVVVIRAASNLRGGGHVLPWSTDPS